MQKRVIITRMQPENRKEYLFTCLLEGSSLSEITAEQTAGPREDDSPVLGDIYIGRVNRIVRGIHAAFIEVRPRVMCYYPLDGEQSPVYVRGSHNGPLKGGDEILVQISRESMKTKEPAVSSNLSFPGRYLVLTSEKRQINVSSKLNRLQKEHYRKLFETDSTRDYGLIVRTNAAEVPDEAVLAECAYLEEVYHRVLEAAPHRICFSRLYAGEASWKKFLKGTYRKNLSEIVTDDPVIYKQICEECSRYPDYRDISIRFYEDRIQPLPKVWNLEKELQRALRRRVWLKSGGYLVIDSTEALTAIDVNSGKSTGKKQVRDHLKKINFEAAAEISRQLRLRNISGLILVDFINLKSAAEEEELLSVFRSEVKADPIPVQVVDMTRLGLVEVTRKKVSKTLAEQLTK